MVGNCGDPIAGKPYKKGPPVDAADKLRDGRKFANVTEYKKLLLADPDGLARAFTEKLLTYATGAEPQRKDAEEVERLVAQIKPKNYGLRSLVHAITQSPLFTSK